MCHIRSILEIVWESFQSFRVMLLTDIQTSQQGWKHKFFRSAEVVIQHRHQLAHVYNIRIKLQIGFSWWCIHFVLQFYWVAIETSWIVPKNPTLCSYPITQAKLLHFIIFSCFHDDLHASYKLNITFVFDRCHRILAVVTPISFGCNLGDLKNTQGNIPDGREL